MDKRIADALEIIRAKLDNYNKLIEAGAPSGLEFLRSNGYYFNYAEQQWYCKTLERSVDTISVAKVAELEKEVAELKKQLETERMRLAACGVIAFANTVESAKQARTMHPDYMCASVRDVCAAVDREMQLRETLNKIQSKKFAFSQEEFESLVSGIVYSFAAYLTAGSHSITVGSSHECGPIARAVSEFLQEKNISKNVNPDFNWSSEIKGS